LRGEEIVLRTVGADLPTLYGAWTPLSNSNVMPSFLELMHFTSHARLKILLHLLQNCYETLDYSLFLNRETNATLGRLREDMVTTRRRTTYLFGIVIIMIIIITFPIMNSD
jgi:hypothetical protein